MPWASGGTRNGGLAEVLVLASTRGDLLLMFLAAASSLAASSAGISAAARAVRMRRPRRAAAVVCMVAVSVRAGNGTHAVRSWMALR